MIEQRDYTAELLAGFAAAIFIFCALVMIVKIFRQKEPNPTYWTRHNNGLWEFCDCGKPTCKICKPGREL